MTDVRATYHVISWRTIPAVVEARDPRETVTRSLSERFHMLIDSAAMQLGLEGSEAYLAEWTRSEPLGTAMPIKADRFRQGHEDRGL